MTKKITDLKKKTQVYTFIAVVWNIIKLDTEKIHLIFIPDIKETLLLYNLFCLYSILFAFYRC